MERARFRECVSEVSRTVWVHHDKDGADVGEDAVLLEAEAEGVEHRAKVDVAETDDVLARRQRRLRVRDDAAGCHLRLGPLDFNVDAGRCIVTTQADVSALRATDHGCNHPCVLVRDGKPARVGRQHAAGAVSGKDETSVCARH